MLVCAPAYIIILIYVNHGVNVCIHVYIYLLLLFSEHCLMISLLLSACHFLCLSEARRIVAAMERAAVIADDDDTEASAAAMAASPEQ